MRRSLTTTNQLFSFGVSVALSLCLFGCYSTGGSSVQTCPPILAEPDTQQSGILYGKEESPRLTAQITTVNAECIPIKYPAVKNEKIERGAFANFAIAVTANVKYEMKNEDEGNREIEGIIIFDALSDSNVLIKSQEEKFNFQQGNTEAIISTRFPEMNEGEMSVIKVIRARWSYSK